MAIENEFNSAGGGTGELVTVINCSASWIARNVKCWPSQVAIAGEEVQKIRDRMVAD